MAGDKAKPRIGKHDAGQLDRWHRNAASQPEILATAEAQTRTIAREGNQNSLVYGIYADRCLSPDESALFEAIIGQLYQDFVFNKSSDFMQVELVAVYFLKLARAQEGGDWDAAERLDRMIRCHLKDLKATQIAREGETPSQAEPTNRARLREGVPALARKWAVAGDPRQHIPGRDGRDAVDLPVAVVNRSPEAVCRFAVGVEDSCPHWVPNRRRNGAKRGQLGAKTGPKVCQTDPRADNNGLAEQVAYRGLAMESQAAETFVNQSFRSSPEGSIAAQLTFGDCVQGGDGAHCQLTVSGFCECLSWGGNRKAAPKDRLISGPAYRLEPFEGVLEGGVDQVGACTPGNRRAIAWRCA